MFDAKSLLNLALGAGRSGGGSQGGGLQGGLGSIVGQVLSGLQNQGGQSSGAPTHNPPMTGQSAGQMVNQPAPAAGAAGLAGQLPASMQDALRQAQEAVRTGNYASLTNQAKGFLTSNAGGLFLGGVAGLAIGTKRGRSLVGTAAKLGGVALVGGLAYKAWRNYQQGRPIDATAQEMSADQPMLAAPHGSGFAEGDGDDQAKALLMLRAMAAAAAADGHIDAQERERIMGNLRQAGLDDEAAMFLDHEFANPMNANVLAAMATTPEMAAQVYTAARLAIDPDTMEERRFLAALSASLNLDASLVAHIDAAAESVTTAA